MKTMKLVGVLLTMLLCTTVSLSMYADDSAVAEASMVVSPHQVVEQATDDVLALIESSREWVDDDPERFFAEVEEILSPAINFEGFARSVMAANYKKATPEQRERFAENFKWSLVRTYSLALTGFSDGEVSVLEPDAPRRHEKRESVKQEIRTGGGELYTVVYSMGLEKDGVWRVRNLIIQGVNIGLTFRSQFASAVADKRYGGDLDQVIEAWTQNIAASGTETGNDET
jgi:phospholipid transport system substrate-binding protein